MSDPNSIGLEPVPKFGLIYIKYSTNAMLEDVLKFMEWEHEILRQSGFSDPENCLQVFQSVGWTDLVMIYKQLEFKLGTSELDSISTAVFWGQAGGVITEFANSLSASSAFQYRLSGSTLFQDRVTGVGNLPNIVVIRFSAFGSVSASRANRDSLTFDLTISVPLGNAY